MGDIDQKGFAVETRVVVNRRLIRREMRRNVGRMNGRDELERGLIDK